MQICRNMQVNHVTAKCKSCKKYGNIIPQKHGDTVHTFFKDYFHVTNSMKIPFSKVCTVYN